MPVRFKIQDIKLLNVIFSHDPMVQMDQEKGGMSLNIEVKCQTEYSKDDRRLKVYLDLQSGDQSAFLQFRVRIGGLFELDQDPPEEELSRIRHVNCPAILFPYVREVVADLTRRAGIGPIHLPPANFVELSRRTAETAPGESAE